MMISFKGAGKSWHRDIITLNFQISTNSGFLNDHSKLNRIKLKKKIYQLGILLN